MKQLIKSFVTVLILAMQVFLAANIAAEQVLSDDTDQLMNGFSMPPGEARPRVWWHWMNGNITQAGIVKDLEWMHRIGIGGVHNFDIAMETPVIVDQRLSYMSTPWKAAFKFAVEKADELGLEFGVASSAGWSLTGGPWVRPEDGMKKLVWTEIEVDGGETRRHRLAQPSGENGPYQSLKANYKHSHNPDAIPESFYQDVAVLAYPIERPSSVVVPQAVLANGEEVDGTAMFDSVLSTGIPLPEQGETGAGVLEFRYPTPQTLQSAVIFIANLPSSIMQGALKPRLEAMNEQGEWESVVEMDMTSVPTTVSFSPVTSDRFRVVLDREEQANPFRFSPAAGIDPSGLMGLGSGATDPPLLTDLRLLAEPRVHRFEAKAGFTLVNNYHQIGGTPTEPLAGVQPSAVLDLSNNLSVDGELAWDAPPGRWKILRIGYSLTGKTNSPATVEATGLEVDKYDGAAVRRYLNHYLGMYRQILGDKLVGVRGLRTLLTDSVEAGPSNWTPRMAEHFERLRGYKLLPWIPALTGEIVGTREQSDKFLYDFRRTLAELNTMEHYGTVAEVAHREKLIVYGESLEGNRLVSTLGDDLEMRRFADIPMAAMWSFANGAEPAPQYVADMRGAASVAHIYGKRCVAAESLTSILAPWAHGPAELQPMIDAEFLSGINCPVIHASPHQPVDDKTPGLSLHVFGQYFTRHETWSEMARPWIDYIARNSFLLQQGRNVADVAYFYGEEPPISVLASTEGLPSDVPTGYGYDFLPPQALLDELVVVDGRLETSGGARYAALFLGENSRGFMTLPVLQRISELVEEGAIVVGMPPTASPALADNAAEFSALVARLWTGVRSAKIGSGTVITAENVEQALVEIGLLPDFSVGGEDSLGFVHRQLEAGELYFVANRGPEREFIASFRTTGRVPEIWRADTGQVEQVSYEIVDGVTRVPLVMNARESFHVVFRRPAAEPKVDISKASWQSKMTIDSPWQVSFSSPAEAPSSMVFKELRSLSEHATPAVRYFSGTSHYRNTFVMSESVGGPLRLDLGQVGDIAEVYVNGEYAGTAWKPPYQVDIGNQIVQGENTLEIRVANLWVNRLIGDRQAGSEPVAYTTFSTYLPGAPLRPAGLIGPVRVLSTLQRQL